MIIKTVSNLIGVIADYTTIQDAFNFANTQTDDITIYVFGGEYYEETTATFTVSDLIKMYIYGFGGAKLNGKGVLSTGITLNNIEVSKGNVFSVHGLDIIGYTSYAIRPSSLGGFSGFPVKLHNLTIENFCAVDRSNEMTANDVTFKNTKFVYSTSGSAGLLLLKNFNQCTFVSCEDIRINTQDTAQYFTRNAFKNCKIRLLYNLSTINVFKYNLLDNCEFSAHTNSTPITSILTQSYTPVLSISDINNILISEGYSSIITDSDFVFHTITLDQFNFPTSEAEYILNRHQGANRYAAKAPFPSPPAGWAILADSMYTISDTPAPLVLIASIPQARKARRVTVNFERANDIEQFGANGAIEILVSLSFDGGLTFDSPAATVISGIQASTLDFDYLDYAATDFKLTIESQGIAGGAGGIILKAVHVEFYDMDEQITAGTRTLYEQKATNSEGYFIVGLPYKVQTGLGDFTAQEIKDNPAATKVYSDIDEDNIVSFSLGGIVYETFVSDPVEITGVRAIKAGIGGSDIEIKNVPCSNFNHKMLKFKNGAGVWEYLLFYAKDEEKPSRSSEQYLQFEDGYKNVNGDIQRDFKLYNDEIDIVNKPVLDYLDKNQNVWYANDWQFSSFTTILMPSTAQNFPLLTNERLLKADLTQDQFNEVYKRFKTGDRVTFATSDYLIDMYGFVSQMSESNGVYTVYFKFTGATGNDDLVSLDSILGDTDAYIVAYDAWELCTIDNLTVTTTSRSLLSVNLTLKTNPETNYRV